MKTKYEIWRKYITETVPMAEAAGIDPWLCVKYEGRIHDLGHPTFLGLPEHYTFALTVLEGRPVFVGDKLWLKGGHQITVEDNLYINTGVMTWTSPTKKRTFMLGDKELPCPIKTKSDYWFVLAGETFNFHSKEDREFTYLSIHEFLATARDKD